MLKHLIKKEVISIVRDRRIQISGSLILILMISALFVSKEGQKQVQLEREAVTKEMHDLWVNQQPKHPHTAAHFGQIVFKPKSVLSFLDTGIDNYTGVSIFLEAHKQHEVLFSQASENNVLVRFGDLTIALIVQLIFPLLIIFLTFNSFSKEREEGTLKLLYSQGVSINVLFAGKVIGTYLTILVLFIPTMAISYSLLDQNSILVDNQVLGKFVLLILVYSIYFLVIILVSTLVSALSKSSNASLVTLIAIWSIACIIIPKASASISEKLYPSPTQFEFRNTIAEKVRNGIDGHNPSDERLNDLKQQILEEYNVETVDQLPVNWSGIAFQAGEEYTDAVYDQEFSNVERIFKKQNTVSEWVGFFNPFIAVKNLTMGLAGTDYHHHVTFATAAENYRRSFIKVMNKDMELNHKPDISYSDYDVGSELYGTIEPFSYIPPSIASILNTQWRGGLALVLWVMFMGLSIPIYSNRISKL